MGPAKESKIDFFIIDVELAKAVKEVTVREEVTFHPHRPVLVKFAEKPADMRYLAFDDPPKLPTEKFLGPRQQSHGHGGQGRTQVKEAEAQVLQLREQSGEVSGGAGGLGSKTILVGKTKRRGPGEAQGLGRRGKESTRIELHHHVEQAGVGEGREVGRDA